jgi:hypothetical protein
LFCLPVTTPTGAALYACELTSIFTELTLFVP